MIGQTKYEDEIFYVVVPKSLAQVIRQTFEKEGIHAKGRNFTRSAHCTQYFDAKSIKLVTFKQLQAASKYRFSVSILEPI